MRSDSASNSAHAAYTSSSAGQRSMPQQIPSDRRFQRDGVYFCSRSEVACAVLMQRYLGYRCIEGLSFQVPMGVSSQGHVRHFDFLIFDTVLEFHPFHPPKKNPQYWKVLHRLGPGQRQKFRELWERNDELRYNDTRRKQLDTCSHLRNKELIVARSPEDFYEKVIVRFMQERHIAPFRQIPDLASFLQEFEQIGGDVIELKASRAKRVRVRPAEARKRKQG